MGALWADGILLREYCKRNRAGYNRNTENSSALKCESKAQRWHQMEMQMEFRRKLPIPQELKQQFPLSQEIRDIKEARDKEIEAIFTGKDQRFLLIIGPCSADREDAVLEYMTRLAKVQEKVKDKIFIIPRVYTNKPRTKGVGYKGMLHQPDPEKKEDMLAGIIAIREMHSRVVKETGFTCAEEMLYPENHRYLSDLLAYVAIGARSVEDQQHRMVASGIGIPAGMKNPTSGDISVMMNSITAAQSEQTFLYRGWEVHTTGNPMAHAILRGYVDNYGSHRRLQPQQLRQAVHGADPHRKGRAPQHACLPGHRKDCQGPDDRELPGGRQPEDRRRRVRKVHHGPMPWLGEVGKADLRHRRRPVKIVTKR